MPYRVEKKVITGMDGRQALGVKLPFSSDSVFTPTYQTVDMYKTNLINYLLTDKGDRYFNSEFGSNIRAMMFEPNIQSKKDTLISTLKYEIGIYFPKLIIDNIEITDLSEHTIQVYLRFHIKDTGVGSELVVNFE